MLLCAPHSYRPTTHQDTRTPTSQPHQTRRPSSQQGAPYLSDPPPGAGLIPLETSLLALPGQRCTLLDSKGSPGCTFAPGHAPELGSSSSCSGGSAVGLPACLGFTSRSWSRARFFSWGRHRKEGLGTIPPSGRGKSTPNARQRGPCATAVQAPRKSLSQQAFFCPHLARHSPQGGKGSYRYGPRKGSLSEPVRAGGALGLSPILQMGNSRPREQRNLTSPKRQTLGSLPMN